MPSLDQSGPAQDQPGPERTNEQLVKDFLKAQNLEQIGRLDDAIALYESVVDHSFDAAGPYDRLIWIYQQQRRHRDVIRVAEACLAAIRTYPLKRQWYQTQIELAKKDVAAVPDVIE